MEPAFAGYATLLRSLPATLAAAQVPIWKLGLAVAGCGALVYAATFITKVEKRLPLVYYKRRLKVQLTSSLISAQDGVHANPNVVYEQPLPCRFLPVLSLCMGLVSIKACTGCSPPALRKPTEQQTDVQHWGA